MLTATLLERLREFFVDVTEDNVEFHLGDLFDPSQFRLRDVFLKTEIVNALHLPCELKAGYIGDVKVEGFVGFVLGHPLTISVENVSLVLGHKPVDWNNELAWRYAKELLVTICHSILTYIPTRLSSSSNSNASSSSVREIVRWIANKVLSTIAQTTVKLDRLHVRFESDYEGQTIAYGLHVPTLAFSTRDIEDQILNRREQPGVTYPSAQDANTASKRLYLANTAAYCDLKATSFLHPAPPETTTPTDTSEKPLTDTDRYDFMRERCKEPFEPCGERDLASISALWLKLDFVRGEGRSLTAWQVSAVDVVTEEIKVNGDLTQLKVMQEELARFVDFSKRSQRRAWLPSWVDRDRIAPPHATLSSTALMPVVTADEAARLSIDSSPRRLNRSWLRGMWRYAAHCILVDHWKQAGKQGTTTTLSLRDEMDHETRRERYIALYSRSLSEEALKIAVWGRVLVPSSPRATDTKHAAVLLPVGEPLSRLEQWELSDLVLMLSVKEQAEMRKLACKLLRDKHASSQPTSVPISSVPDVSSDASTRQSLVLELEEASSVETVDETPPARRGSGAHVSPKHCDSLSTDASLMIETDASPSLHPLEFVANHHQFTRSRAESSPTGSPTKHHSVSPPSPTSTYQGHAPFRHAASAPIKRHKQASSPHSSPTKAFSLRGPPSPTALRSQKGFIEILLPPSLLAPTARPVPLINWRIGPVSVRFHHRVTKLDDSSGVFSSSSAPIPPRSTDMFMELHVDGCTGCALLCRSPLVSLLVELRVGLVKLGLVDLASATTSSSGNAISTEYIREPSDGFLYLGLKYNFKHAAPRVPTSLLTSPVEEQSWDIKAKLCVGTIRMEYNDMALQTALRTTQRRESLGNLEAPLSLRDTIRLGQATHASVIYDVLRNWKSCVQEAEQEKKKEKKKASVTADSKDLTDDQTKQKKKLQAAAKHAKLTQLLNALMRQSSCVDVDVGGLELVVSMLTSTVVKRLRRNDDSPDQSLDSPRGKQPLPLFDSEQVAVTLPPISAGLHNRPLLNECEVHGAGARVTFRTTKQGRTAVVDHILRRAFPQATV